jgi:hypothetical protein
MDDRFAARNLKPTMPRLSRERKFALAELQSFERLLDSNTCRWTNSNTWA